MTPDLRALTAERDRLLRGLSAMVTKRDLERARADRLEAERDALRDRLAAIIAAAQAGGAA